MWLQTRAMRFQFNFTGLPTFKRASSVKSCGQYFQVASLLCSSNVAALRHYHLHYALLAPTVDTRKSGIWAANPIEPRVNRGQQIVRRRVAPRAGF